MNARQQKKYYIILALLIFITKPCFADPSKKALIIAIETYEDKSWPQLSSGHDLELIKQMLLRQQFENSNILTIQNEKATKVGITTQLKSLISKCKQGDCVFIHFSGHGQEVQDLDNDENDSYDEALVPYDAPATLKKKAGYRGEQHLLDDEIAIWINTLRKKIGIKGHLLITLDCCHAGTASREDEEVIIRGSFPPLIFDKAPTNKLRSAKKQVYSDYPTNTGDFVLIAGVNARNSIYQTVDSQNKPVGSLSYALVKVFESLESSVSYKEVIQKINEIYIKKNLKTQKASCEGNTNSLVMGGRHIIQKISSN